MSEVSGSIIIKLPELVNTSLSKDDHRLTIEDIKLILKASSINVDDSIKLLDGDYSHEGHEVRDGFMLIYPFDEDYMRLMQRLTKEAKGIEIYGGIFHEYGVSQFYVLTKDGTRFFGQFDQEGEDDVDPVEIRSKFSQLVPESVKKIFPDVFG